MFRSRKGNSDVPVDEDAQILRFEEVEKYARVNDRMTAGLLLYSYTRVVMHAFVCYISPVSSHVIESSSIALGYRGAWLSYSVILAFRPEDPLPMLDRVQNGVSCIIDDRVCRQVRAKYPVLGIVFT
jgi:hypothetical protein